MCAEPEKNGRMLLLKSCVHVKRGKSISWSHVLCDVLKYGCVAVADTRKINTHATFPAVVDRNRLWCSHGLLNQLHDILNTVICRIFCKGVIDKYSRSLTHVRENRAISQCIPDVSH